MRVLPIARPLAWTWAVLPLAALLAAGPARAERLPLPPGEQAEVNRAIDRGVDYLKIDQLPSGTWSADGKHAAGYAALPGLTLLECGVPPDDPAVRRAAAFVRKAAPTMDHTYELALSILFLDRLGDPKDDKLIQTLALRLVAGQSQTGGWGYRCPVLPSDESHELLTLLRKLDPQPGPQPDLLAGGPGPGFPAGNPAAPPGRPAGNPGPGDRPAPNGPGLAGGPTTDPGSLSGGAVKSPGESLNPVTKSPGEAGAASPASFIGLSPGPAAGDRTVASLQDHPASPSSRDWNWCIRSEEEPPDPAPAPDKPKAPPAPVVPKPVHIPPEFKHLTVVQDPDKLLPMDPPNKNEALIFATTDNSNTQFAVLALWVAQRHGVPMNRTLRLIAKRFQTSQNPDGSWGYHYLNGGGEPERETMDCVGLLGLAVGHGLARAGQAAAGRPQDPQVLNGFAALSRHVGAPAGRTRDLPPANLYYLWSVERAAVLYGLPTIADKDWYRWGAEILVANQAAFGEWDDGGGYYGATPPLNTCFALLFLKKANLVTDLTAALPFRPDELSQSIKDRVAPKETKPEEKPADPGRTAKPPAETPASLDGLAAPAAPPAAAPPAPSADAGPTRTGAGEGGRGWLVLVLVLLALLLLAASGAVLLVHFRNRKQEVKTTKKVKKRKTELAEGRRASGRTRLRA